MKIDCNLDNAGCAIVTGATSGIGMCIALHLLKSGRMVYGIGRNFDKCVEVYNEFSRDGRFIPIKLDLRNIDKTVEIVGEIKKKEDVKILVNAAGVGFYGLHEELNPQKIHDMVTVNFEIPLILAQLFLRDFKKNNGIIINVSSVTAKQKNPHGCAYGATKAGLSNFGESLFEETRKYGVKVVTIHPDMTETDLYRNADFTVGDEKDTFLTPEEIAECIDYILNIRSGAIISDITVRPQKHCIKRKTNEEKMLQRNRDKH